MKIRILLSDNYWRVRRDPKDWKRCTPEERQRIQKAHEYITRKNTERQVAK